MTLKEVQDKVAFLYSVREDAVTFHGAEDDFYEAFVKAIADGTCTDPVACAKELLKTKDWEDAERWYE